MNIAIDEHFDQFIREQVSSGRFQSGDEVVMEGLRLLESLQSRTQALQKRLKTVLDEGGSLTDDEVAAFLAADDDGLDFHFGREAKLQVLRDHLEAAHGPEAVYSEEDLDELLWRGEFSCSEV